MVWKVSWVDIICWERREAGWWEEGKAASCGGLREGEEEDEVEAGIIEAGEEERERESGRCT